MTDGHSGIENNEIIRGNTPHFQLILSLLKTADGDADFIIHVTSNVHGPTPSPLKFINDIGFIQFDGVCHFFPFRCFWKHFASFEEYEPGIENIRQVQEVHNAFKSLVDNIERLYSIYQEQYRIMGVLKASSPTIKLFGDTPILKLEPSEIPPWTEAIKFNKLIELEKQYNEIGKLIKDLQEYLPLVYSDSDILVASVSKALKLFKLNASLTEEGNTIDIYAETPDKTKQFGIEVTGCIEGIKKESKKPIQLLDFELNKENKEKTILIANTYKNTPIYERNTKEHFTRNVVDFLSKYPILLMTGYDLYNLVRDVLEKGKNPDDVVELLYNINGVLKL